MHSYENEPIVVQREVKAVAIPAGVEVNLKLGSVGYITQALGGSFTVYIDGNLFRIAGQDADAIGKTAAKAPEVPPGASEQDIKNGTMPIPDRPGLGVSLIADRAKPFLWAQCRL